MLSQSTYPIYFDQNIVFSPSAHVVFLASCAVSYRFEHSAKLWIRKKQFIPTKKPASWVSSPRKFHTKKCRKFSSSNVEVNPSNVSNIPPRHIVWNLDTSPWSAITLQTPNKYMYQNLMCWLIFLVFDYCPPPPLTAHMHALTVATTSETFTLTCSAREACACCDGEAICVNPGQTALSRAGWSGSTLTYHFK